jgi:hypothetical protein
MEAFHGLPERMWKALFSEYHLLWPLGQVNTACVEASDLSRFLTSSIDLRSSATPGKSRVLT